MLCHSEGPQCGSIRHLQDCISIFGRPDDKMDSDHRRAGTFLEQRPFSFEPPYFEYDAKNHKKPSKGSRWVCEGNNDAVFTTTTHENSSDVGKAITSLLLRNIPSCCTTSMLMNELHAEGFRGVYNFLYHPVHHQTGEPRSFAFLNFATPLIATAFYLQFNGMSLKCACDGEEPLVVNAAVQQGLAANRASYEACKSKCRRKFRVRPIEPIIDGHRVCEAESVARRVLMDLQCS